MFWHTLSPMLLNHNKWEKKLKVEQNEFAQDMYFDHLLRCGDTEDEAIAAAIRSASSNDFLKPYIQRFQKITLQGDRSAVRFLKTVPYLYTNTELRPFWEKQLNTIKI